MANLCTITGNTVVSRICSSATWEQNSITFFKDFWNNYWYYNDFALDSDNNLILGDRSNNRVAKFTGKNFTVVTLLAAGNRTYYLETMFVHSSGAIYTVESRYNYTSWQRLYRIQRYADADGITGVTLFDETSCGTAPNQICGCNNLFVDSQGGIYCSDSQNHRVVKIIPYTSTLIVIAGTTNGTSGYQLNELSYPSSIFVDKVGNLFVLDSGNYRILKFTPGSRNGTSLFSTSWYSWGSYMLVDDFGIIYYTTYNAVYRWVPGTTYPTMILSGVSFSRLRFDTYGNLYTIDYSKDGEND
ncbi:unnamed protein product [Rotaria sordida]|nr:unnamed protein product [Rotaria sordida]CAF3637591.1 unnamed protein product [Rotaria sordida]